jgi:hypothetical protein
MKSKKKTARPGRKKFLLPPLFGLFVLGRSAEAQQSQSSVIQPLTPPVESATQINMTNNFQVFGAHPAATAPGEYEPFRWNQVVFRPHADYTYTVAYGILAAPSNHVDTTIQDISPGILINIGPHWALDYTATIGIYSNTNFQQAFNNSITLSGTTVFTDWLFGFTQTANLDTSPLIETGGQTQTQTYGTSITGHHENSQYISEDIGLYQTFFYVQGGFENNKTWNTMNWLNYQPQSRFNLGIGTGFGYNMAESGPDSIFFPLQGRINWRARDKLSFSLSGGFQFTEFLGGQGANNLFSPIYSGSIQYQLFAQTQISAFASRSFNPSMFVGEYSDLTSVGASFSQRFLGQFFLSLSGSYNRQQYVASSTDILANRTDKYYALTARLGHTFLQRGNISVFYQYGNNNSTFPGYSYSSPQFGGEVSYSF